MATTNVPEENDYLVGGKGVNQMFSISTSTRQRMKKDGRLSQPDVPGGTGANDKWLHSTLVRDLSRMVAGVAFLLAIIL